ncbi:MSHA biogenesis protein MshK [uncultured Shewanella sp.]|uniref:MSHA biogenesis protein MshK n=1 Tax=Shewanella atlantica TaxID=271099 RepID=UPI00262A0ACA|nr:MSHA biogenesis protein MshK [uncultured Shewanella sp.]
MLQIKASSHFSVLKSLLVSLLVLLTSTVHAETLRDPTRPGRGAAIVDAGSSGTGSALVLNSIVKAESASHAVINNKIFVVGDRVQGVKIVRIDTGSVSLADGRKLKMYQAITETKGNKFK